MRASRAVPDDMRLDGADHRAPQAAVLRAVPRAGEVGRLSVADPTRAPLPGVVAGPLRRWPVLGSMLLHGGVLAALAVLTARSVLPPEPEPSIPLVFEGASPPAPALAAAPTSAPPVPPPTLAVPATPELPEPPATAEAAPIPPVPDLPPAEAPTEVTAAPVSPAMPDSVPSVPQLARPRLPAAPPSRPVPHLAPPRPTPALRNPVAPPPLPGTVARLSPQAPAHIGPAPALSPVPAAEASVPAQPIAGAPGNVQPDYPEAARRRGVQGRVVVRAVVSTAGRTVSAGVAQSSGSEALDHAAVDAVLGYRFTPASRGGVAVQGVAELPFTFRLQ